MIMLLNDTCRHIKKDRKYYIENLNCYVTRVKTVINFEHLRHGVPDSEQEIIDAGHDSPPVVPITPALPAPTPPVQPSVTPTIMSQQQHQWPPSPSSDTRPGDYHNYTTNSYGHDNLASASALPGYFHQPGPTAYRDTVQAEGAMRELALRRWLSDSSQMSNPAHSSRIQSELGTNPTTSIFFLSIHGSTGIEFRWGHVLLISRIIEGNCMCWSKNK